MKIEVCKHTKPIIRIYFRAFKIGSWQKLLQKKCPNKFYNEIDTFCCQWKDRRANEIPELIFAFAFKQQRAIKQSDMLSKQVNGTFFVTIYGSEYGNWN